ncbi:hypothetical protein SAMN05892883_3965 [Jatrophihabitans sp. GAS493]|uniref:hypothetical protein n=1 Tax=Jatrophihabitans sp. GAS493 TaxID=1907575 RepID=UPI000BC004CA|nr:hypothetical protein [Jatrophihabitans sp. GAS493]SOD74774.1 hypothetical protein SAMN05892883_3965 [Jatrophihabitans sp. GAS493]
MKRARRAFLARMARVRGTGVEAVESGFALIYTLVVTTIVLISATSMLVVTANGIVPAKTSQDASRAVAAAEAGVQYYQAWLNIRCSTLSSSTPCPSLSTSTAGAGLLAVNAPGTTITIPGSGAAGLAATFTVDTLNLANNLYISQHKIRIKSTGTVGKVSRSIVADITPAQSTLDLAYSSTYETVGSQLIAQQNPKRTIALPSSSVLNSVLSGVTGLTSILGAGLGSGSSVTWNGNPPATWCDNLYYPTDEHDPSTGALYDPGMGGSITGQTYGRQQLRSSINPAPATGYDWTEGGNLALVSLLGIPISLGALTAQQHSGLCAVAMTSGQTFTGPVYSKDALYLSKVTNTGLGPQFLEGASTGWTADKGAPSLPYVQFQEDLLQTLKSNVVSDPVDRPQLPAEAEPATPTCIYYGPTRIVVNGATATVTSPETLASPSASAPCYNSAPGLSVSSPPRVWDPAQNEPVTGTGVAGATISSTAAIVVKNAGDNDRTKWPASTGSPAGSYLATGGKTSAGQVISSNPIFKVSSGAVSQAADTGPTQVSALFTAKWANQNLPPCVLLCSGTSLNSQSTFDSEVPTYASLQATVQSSSDPIGTLTNTLTTKADTTHGAPAPSGQSDHRYVVVAGSPTTTTTAVATSPTTYSPSFSDALMQNSDGTYRQNGTKTDSKTVYSVYRENAVCSVLNVLGACIGTWSWSAPASSPLAFTVTNSSTSTKYTAPTIISSPTSNFPVSADRTVYNTYTTDGKYGPGDAYIEGSNSGKLSVIAEDDIIDTGTLTNGGSAAQSYKNGTGATALTAWNNVRIYHPVACKLQTTTYLAATDAGFCPNDTTGLYTYNTLKALLGSNHPSAQYVEVRPDLSKIDINAAIFALGSTLSSSGMEGSFTTDNPDKGSFGANGGSANVFGGVYQLHRGTNGTQWERTTTTDNTPPSGYDVSYNYVDLSNSGLPWIPTKEDQSTSWSVGTLSSPTGN